MAKNPVYKEIPVENISIASTNKSCGDSLKNFYWDSNIFSLKIPHEMLAKTSIAPFFLENISMVTQVCEELAITLKWMN